MIEFDRRGTKLRHVLYSQLASLREPSRLLRNSDLKCKKKADKDEKLTSQ
jgi:hypothetical protein